MNNKQLEYLKNKMVSMQTYLDKQLEDKKAMNAGFAEEINATKKRMSSYARAIRVGEEFILSDVMTETEYEEFARIN
jgi:hypothetical protein